jgi:ABC-type Fe3+-hydroxamate transport system substrate-binding protein
MPARAELDQWATMIASHVEKERKKLTGLAEKKKKASRAMWGGGAGWAGGLGFGPRLYRGIENHLHFQIFYNVAKQFEFNAALNF